MSKMIVLVLLSVFTVNAVAESSARPKVCFFWGFLNDIVYRYNGICSDGKLYFRDSFLGPLVPSRRRALKERVLKDMAKDDLVPALNFNGYEILTEKSNTVTLQRSTLCFSMNQKINCTPGAAPLTFDASGQDSADTTLGKNGYTKIFDVKGYPFKLHMK